MYEEIGFPTESYKKFENFSVFDHRRFKLEYNIIHLNKRYLNSIKGTSMQNSVGTYWSVKFLNFWVDFFALFLVIAFSIFVEDSYQVRHDTKEMSEWIQPFQTWVKVSMPVGSLEKYATFWNENCEKAIQ